MGEIPAVIGRYQIRSRLGEGGMGVVYLAHDPAMDSDVAIKLLRDTIASEELRKRFAREAQMARRVGVHPNVVTIFDIGEHEGRDFIAMEYVAGETLEQVIHHGETLPPLRRRLQIVEELCVGLMHAHKAGLVHRDIKPANIMIAESGAVKILDFGVARLAESDLTADGVVIGALNYMSPEQMTGMPLDSRSDVFAVGAVFYELLSGKRAFPGSLREGLPYRIIHGTPPPLAELVEPLDPEIDRIVQHALEKDPANRYQDLATMRTDIARARRRLQATARSGAQQKVTPPAPSKTEALATPGAPPASATPVPPLAPPPAATTPTPIAALPAAATPARTAAPSAAATAVLPTPAARSRRGVAVVGVAVLIAGGAIAWFAGRSGAGRTPQSQTAPPAPVAVERQAVASPQSAPGAAAGQTSSGPTQADKAPAVEGQTAGTGAAGGGGAHQPTSSASSPSGQAAAVAPRPAQPAGQVGAMPPARKEAEGAAGEGASPTPEGMGRKRHARVLYLNGHRDQALVMLAAGLAEGDSDQEWRMMARNWHQQAAAAAANARVEADGKQAATKAPEPYQQAVRAEEQAKQLMRSSDMTGAIRALWQADELFVRAGQQASGSTAPAAAPKVVPVANAAAEADILKAMREFAVAWNRRDADGVRRVFPAFSADTAPRFQNFELQFENMRVSIDGTHASVQTVVSHVPRGSAGRGRQARRSDAVFHFEQRPVGREGGGSWVMLGNQPVQKEPKDKKP